MGDGSFAEVVHRRQRLPAGATPVNATSGNVAAVATTLPVCGQDELRHRLRDHRGGATAAALVVATLAGLLGGTATYIFGAVRARTCRNHRYRHVPKPLPASAVNTAITLTLPSLGAGNTNAAVNDPRLLPLKGPHEKRHHALSLARPEVYEGVPCETIVVDEPEVEAHLAEGWSRNWIEAGEVVKDAAAKLAANEAELAENEAKLAAERMGKPALQASTRAAASTT
jgi:hypothetical protein